MIGLHLTTQGSSVLGNPPGRNIPGSAHSTRYVKPEYSGTRMTRVKQASCLHEPKVHCSHKGTWGAILITDFVVST